MKKEYEEFFNCFKRFRKLKITSILPDSSMNHTNFATLMTIRCCCDEYNAKGKKVAVSLVSERTHMNTTAVSRALRKLEEDGLIERSVNPEDRRITYVDITDRGRAEAERTEAVLDDFSSTVFNNMGADDMNRLIGYLTQLYKVAQAEIDLRVENNKKNKQ